MIPTSFAIPSEDAWLISRLSRVIAERLAYGIDTSDVRRSLLRALFALQRLPFFESELSVSISAGRHHLWFQGKDGLSFSSYDDGRTEFCIQYSTKSSHCIHWCDMLEGEEKRSMAESRLAEFEADMQEPDAMFIEDYSTPGPVDEPPIDSTLYGVIMDDDDS